MKRIFLRLLIVATSCFSCSSNDSNTEPENAAKEIYFPPVNSS